MNSSSGPRSVADVLEASAIRLEAAGIETNRLDARLLAGHALGCDQAWLLGHKDEPFPAHLQFIFQELITRRCFYEPVAYLVGTKEFWSLPFRVNSDTLIPRPDSEVLVETALNVLARNARNILDLGTGTGCLLLALLKERIGLQGLGVDSSSAALRVAKGNAASLGLSQRAKFQMGDWEDLASFFPDHRFDVVVSNPPYIPDLDLKELSPDIRWYEPASALKGGRDGLQAYRNIALCLPSLLAPGGFFVGEFGLGQGPVLEDILHNKGLTIEGFQKDFAGRQRCIVARLRD